MLSESLPCDHCGRKNSTAWRRGPLNKPHLCNACGVRYACKGSLDGYMPGDKGNKGDLLYFNITFRLSFLGNDCLLRLEAEAVLT